MIAEKTAVSPIDGQSHRVSHRFGGYDVITHDVEGTPPGSMFFFPAASPAIIVVAAGLWVTERPHPTEPETLTDVATEISRLTNEVNQLTEIQAAATRRAELAQQRDALARRIAGEPEPAPRGQGRREREVQAP